MSWLQAFETLCLIVVVQAIGYFLRSYVQKKGENQATKEDIATITAEIEKVRQLYASQLEELKSSLDVTNRLRSAAVEKRLEKHQEAYTLAVHLLWNLRKESELPKIILTCQDWWLKNSLYLNSEARQAFQMAYLIAPTINQIGYHGESAKVVADVRAAIDAIVRGAALPPLGSGEAQRLEGLESE